MSDNVSNQTFAELESQPPMPVRRLHNFSYCPRLFYFQWVENIFQENADTVAGSHVSLVCCELIKKLMRMNSARVSAGAAKIPALARKPCLIAAGIQQETKGGVSVTAISEGVRR
jgi:hypothetical protein